MARSGIVRERISARQVHEAIKAGREYYGWDWADVPRLSAAVRRLGLDDDLAAGHQLLPAGKPGLWECRGRYISQETLDADREYVHEFRTLDPDGDD